MKITDELIDKLSSLCKIDFEGADRESIKNDLQKILDFVGKLEEVNTNNVEPLIHMTQEVNQLRKDSDVQEISHKEALDNAPEKDSDYFRVPKVVNKD